MAIKFNGVHKSPGRPTLVGGPEGRKYIANKILNNLPVTGAGNYVSKPAQYNNYAIEQDCEYGMDGYGFTDSLNEKQPVEEQAQVSYEGQVYEKGSIWGEEQEYAYQERLRIAAECAAFENQGQEREFNQEQFSIREQYSNQEQAQVFQLTEEETEVVHTSVHQKTAQKKQTWEEGFSVQEILSLAASLENKQQVAAKEREQTLVDIEDADEYLIDDDCNYLNEETEEMLAQKDYSAQMESLALNNDLNTPNRKTTILRVPSQGVVRSSRGTVELLVHANGRTFKPRYNMCGLLIGVSISDGLELVSSRCARGWHMFDTSGNLVEKEKIHTVAFDKVGNLWYQTVSGKSVTYFVDGTTVTRVA